MILAARNGDWAELFDDGDEWVFVHDGRELERVSKAEHPFLDSSVTTRMLNGFEFVPGYESVATRRGHPFANFDVIGNSGGEEMTTTEKIRLATEALRLDDWRLSGEIREILEAVNRRPLEHGYRPITPGELATLAGIADALRSTPEELEAAAREAER
jgi:hypothetical protein